MCCNRNSNSCRRGCGCNNSDVAGVTNECGNVLGTTTNQCSNVLGTTTNECSNVLGTTTNTCNNCCRIICCCNS